MKKTDISKEIAKVWPVTEKLYKYKLWLEVERVEVNDAGEEIGEPENGPHFGYDPEELYVTEDITELEQRKADLLQASQMLSE